MDHNFSIGSINIILGRVALSLFLVFNLCGCARDLASDTYTSDSTINIVLEGQVLSVRNVKIKESDRLADNSTGALSGGVIGGVAGSRSGNSTSTLLAAGAGALLGSATERALSTNNGIEYIVKIDRSKLANEYNANSAFVKQALSVAKTTGVITVVQSKEAKNNEPISVGQAVLVIISDSRARVISDMTRQ